MLLPSSSEMGKEAIRDCGFRTPAFQIAVESLWSRLIESSTACSAARVESSLRGRVLESSFASAISLASASSLPFAVSSALGSKLDLSKRDTFDDTFCD